MKLKNEHKKSDKIILFLLLAISFFSFVLLLISINNEGMLTSIDKKVNLSIADNQASFLIKLSKIVSSIFEPAIFIVFLLLIIIFLYGKKRKKEAFSIGILTLITFSLGELIKIVLQRTRPINALVIERTFSFPSGHALMAIIFFGILIYLFEHHIKEKRNKSLLTASAVILVILISLSRVYLGVHWFSDILASFALGTFLLVLYIIILSHTDIFKTN